jgi:hypothetical protein
VTAPSESTDLRQKLAAGATVGKACAMCDLAYELIVTFAAEISCQFSEIRIRGLRTEENANLATLRKDQVALPPANLAPVVNSPSTIHHKLRGFLYFVLSGCLTLPLRASTKASRDLTLWRQRIADGTGNPCPKGSNGQKRPQT